MCYAPPCPQPPVYIGQNFTQPKKIQKIRLYTTTTINAVVRYSDDANNWNDTNIILINKLPSTSWYEFCLPDFGAHKYWVLWSIGRLSVNEMEMMETSQIAQSQQTPLVLNASMPSTGKKDVAVTFNAQASGGAPPYTYQWDFDDGQFSSEQNPQHIFTAYNEYTVRVLVTDSSNSSAKASQIIGILPF
jgi:PKD repeat protein